jgi:hypothetical protein
VEVEENPGGEVARFTFTRKMHRTLFSHEGALNRLYG